jgi:EAL domain-containing protein (putative c-di-GMP-specific phosphodiesterase class I)/GGDEF domain-containing protein
MEQGFGEVAHPFRDGLCKLREQVEALPRSGSQGSATVHAILILRVDGFDKTVSLTDLESGNRLIEELAKSIRGALRSKDSVFRVGDRDLALILPAVVNPSVSQLAANKILSRLHSFRKGKASGISGGFIGASTYPDDGPDAVEVIRNAFTAMLVAEQTHRPFMQYVPSCLQQLTGRHILEQELLNSIVESQLELYFQPQLCLRRDTIIGAEVLLRWNNNPRIGPVSPAVFIPIAEANGFIDDLTEWVADRALNSCGRVQADHPGCTYSINLSTRTLRRADLKDFISNVLDLWRVPAGALVLEITETAMMEDPSKTAEILRGLKALGVRISIDDFGTGYSSLGYLSNLPLDEVKIDRYLIHDLMANDKNQRIVKTIIALAKNFDMEVVAEGVEDLESLELLKRFGCDKAQGYLIARPMPEGDFLRFLGGWRKA